MSCLLVVGCGLPAGLLASVGPVAASAGSVTGPAGGRATPRVERAGSAPPPAIQAVHRPVLLVPGWNDDAEDLRPLAGRMEDAGWPAERVKALSFEDPVGSNLKHAREIAAAVDELLRDSGFDQVDIVAHSMGGLAVRLYLLEGGAERVRKVVFLASPHRGTVAAHLAWGEGGEEMEPGSAFLFRLKRAWALPDGVRAITIRTPLDLRVLPLESAILPGIPNLEVCCPTHSGMIDHQGTFELVERFLESP